MSVFVLGSKEVVTAFAMGGMSGRVVQDRREALAILEGGGLPAEVKILVIQEEVAAQVRAEVDRLKLATGAPLLVEVPGFAGPSPERREVRELIRQALGIRI